MMCCAVSLSARTPILLTLPLRIENEMYEPLKRFALDNNLGDRVAYAAKTLIAEGLASRGYLTKDFGASVDGPGS